MLLYFFSLPQKMNDPRKEWFNKDRTCMVCGASFKEINNLGRLQCREHWGNLKGNYFVCCGTYAGEKCKTKQQYYLENGPGDGIKKGCIRADHIESVSREHWGALDDNVYTCCGQKNGCFGCLNPMIDQIPKFHSQIDESTQVKASNIGILNIDERSLVTSVDYHGNIIKEYKRYDFKAKQKAFSEVLKIKTTIKK